MAVSTRTRFEVFKRDGFRCRYCGAAADSTPLHVDHVVARANGGGDAMSNLVTACRRCNLGKAAIELGEKVALTEDEMRVVKAAHRAAENAFWTNRSIQQIEEYGGDWASGAIEEFFPFGDLPEGYM